ncbi:MAG: hypothetical protein ACRDL5_03000 [Solirubrobacteraceae bacterium]
MFARAGRPNTPRGLARLALVPPAAFAVHQLRYLLAYGSRAGAELQSQGHSYLHSVVPWLVMAIALAAGAFLHAFGRALGGRRSAIRRRVSLAALWLICAVALATIYCCQELLEGLFATGHPGGLVGVFGNGGWWALPVATVVGLGLAIVFRGATWVLDAVADRRWTASSWPLPSPSPALAVPAVGLRRPPLASGCSRRGPPR